MQRSSENLTGFSGCDIYGEKMINSTLCYMEQEGCFLMLYRNRKKNDLNAGKWVGIGGKFEPGETADEAMLRENREETGLIPDRYDFLGVIEFRNDAFEDEDMYLYRAVLSGCTLGEAFILPGTSKPVTGRRAGILCDEGDLAWVRVEDVLKLNLWEGDKYFLTPLISGETDINIRLEYSGDELLRVTNR